MQGTGATSWLGYAIGGLATLLAGSWLGIWIQGWWNRKKSNAETDALHIKNYENAEKFFQQMMTKLSVTQFRVLKLKQEIAEKEEVIEGYKEQVHLLMEQNKAKQRVIDRQRTQIGEQAEEVRQLKSKQ